MIQPAAKPTTQRPSTGWASLEPSINFTKDYTGSMAHITINFGAAPNNNVDVGRIETLKDLLKIVAGSTPNEYQCNNPTNQDDISGRE